MILLQKLELLSTFYNSLSRPATSWFVAKQVCMCEGDIAWLPFNNLPLCTGIVEKTFLEPEMRIIEYYYVNASLNS